MPTLHQQIAEKFLVKLADSKAVDAERIEQLRALLADSKKLKADEFMKIFTQSDGGERFFKRPIFPAWPMCRDPEGHSLHPQ